MTQPLWDFAISRYQRECVAECCLHLQDSVGADVNMLLSAAWLAERCLCWQHEQVRKLIEDCADWREQCILPLRAVRRYLKGHSLYERSKALELDAEIHQLHLLHDALQRLPLIAHKTSQADALSENLRVYFDCIPIAPSDIGIVDTMLQSLISALR